MDSGCEAVLVDVNVTTTNGINGTNVVHEEVAEMKTRSKVAVSATGDAGDDESAKPKVRLTRTTMAQKSAEDKDASDGEKKDRKKIVRSGGDAEEAAAGAKSVSQEPATTNGDSATTSVASATAGAVSATSVSLKVAAPAPTATPKKRALERDDDSGINSRASSVSNDDVATPGRMRTRSSRASEIAPSTSTPAYGRTIAARVPLAIYEYDAASFDDDLSIGGASTSKSSVGSSAQKRKAVVYVEEMDDEDAEEGDGADSAVEPAAKRRAAFLVSTGAGIVTSLLYPLRKLRSGIAAIRPYKASSSVSIEIGEEENGAVDDVDGAVAGADESSLSAAGETVAQDNDQQPAREAANTCRLM